MFNLKWVLIGMLVTAVVSLVGCIGSQKTVTIEKFYGEVEEGGDPSNLELEESKSDTERTHTYFIDRLEDGERYKEHPRVAAYGNGNIEIIGSEEEGSWELTGSVNGKMYFKSPEHGGSQEVASPLTYKDWVIKWWEGDNYKVIVINDTSRDGQKTFRISLK